jgi:HEAT repeat protein
MHLCEERGRFCLGVLLLALASSVAAQNARVEFLGKSADKWLSDLNSGEPRVRRNAAFALGKLGSGAETGIGPLARLVQMDPSPAVREAAAFSLGEICQGGRGLSTDAFSALKNALAGDREPLVRRSAAFALGSLGSASPEAQQALERALVDPIPAVRQNAAWALGHIGPTAVPALKKALTDADPLVCRDAAGACSLVGKEAHAALPELLACCAPQRDAELRKMALSVLVKLVGPDDKVAVRTLAQALGDPDIEVRRNAALALSNIGGPDAAAAVPVLVEALRTGDLELKRTAAAAIKNIGKDARSALPSLRDALNDPDEELRTNAAVAIGGIGEDAAPVVRDLVRHLADPKESARVRTEAAVALSRIGAVPDAVEAVPTLLGVLGDPADDAKVRERTMWALRVHQGNLRNLNVFPTLTKILSEPKRHETRMLRYDCAYMLGLFLESETPAKALDVLLDFLKDNTILIYTGTSVGAGGASAESKTAKTKIEEKGLGDGRVMAIAALDKIGRTRVVARPDIVQQLHALADSSETQGDLRQKTKELLRKLKK